MIKFPSIESFRQTVYEVRSRWDYKGEDENGKPVYLNTSEYPTIPFKGTVKLHGTNASVVRYKDRLEYQSRERVLTTKDDNMGFAIEMSKKNLDFLFEGVEYENYVAIFGEWCGAGVAKKVAVSQLPKMFVIFGVKIDDVWVDTLNRSDEGQRIFDVNSFETYDIEIDFNTPEDALDRLSEITLNVEGECPVGKHFGVVGNGEGVVWIGKLDTEYRFKVKGDKHKVTREKKIVSIDVEEMKNVEEFVSNTVTENRLEQCLTHLRLNVAPILNQTHTTNFIQWMIRDISKEEKDTIVKNNLDVKKINFKIGVTCKNWFFNYLNAEVFENDK